MKIKFVKTFTIKRKRWLRGRGSGCLLDTVSHKQCCLGIYLTACGLPDAALNEALMPNEIKELSYKRNMPKWLSPNEEAEESSPVGTLAAINDKPSLRYREDKIREGFAAQGVRVRFVD